MDTSNYHVGVQDKSTYVHGSAKGLDKGAGSSHDALAEERAPNVELYAKRWEKGEDIWSGEKLNGAGLKDWKGQRKTHKKFANRNVEKRRRVKIAIKKVGDVRRTVQAYCEEHYQFSPSSNLSAEIITEINHAQLE